MEPLNRRDLPVAHHCFGCGTLNPIGLRLAVYGEGDEVWADFVADRRHEGYRGLVHGGILAALLDEVLGWAFFHRGIWAVTTRLDLTYRAPVPVGARIRVTGRVVRDRGRMLDTVGQIADEGGRTLVEATGRYARIPEAQRAAWERAYAEPAADGPA
jgi:uncharacterized protein (TIGR00369 family)